MFRILLVVLGRTFGDMCILYKLFLDDLLAEILGIQFIFHEVFLEILQNSTTIFDENGVKKYHTQPVKFKSTYI